MVYEFNPKVVNHNNVDSFFNEKNFVGYILPDGSIFKCINHNLTDADAFIRLYLPILDNDYHIKDELLNTNTDNKLTALMAKRLKNMSHEMIHALKDYIEKNKLFLSDVLVSFFGCHLVTRLHKEILTSESNHA